LATEVGGEGRGVGAGRLGWWSAEVIAVAAAPPFSRNWERCVGRTRNSAEKTGEEGAAEREG
jgi:hypothetical protein